MKPTINRLLIKSIFLIGISLVVGCKKQEVEGIKIGDTLLVHQTQTQNQELIKAIQKTIKLDESGLDKLVNFECGGGAGCYDLGFVFSQIIYKIGEDKFVNLVRQIEPNKINGLKGLIEVGLEYGDNDNDGEMDNKKIELEFPNLNSILNR